MKLTLAKVLARKKYQEVVLYLTHLPVSGNFCHQLITFANSLDPDQAGENVFLHPVGIGPSGGWGGTLNFSALCRLGPSIYPSPQKISGISSTKKTIFIILATQKISPFCTMTFRIDPKIHRNDP